MENFTVHTDPDDAYGFESTTLKVRKTIRNRTNKNGLTKVLIEVQKHSYLGTGKYFDEIKRISTNIWINPRNWNKKKELITGGETDADFKNNEIQKKFAAVQTFVSSKGQQRPDQAYVENLDLSSLAEFFPTRKENRKSLCDYFTDYIAFRKGQNTIYNTLKVIESVKNRLLAFDNYRGKKTYFENIDIIWSDEFEAFLRNEADNGKDKKGYPDSTINKTFTVIVTFLNHYYIRRKQLQINLSDDFKIRGSKGSQNGFKRGSKAINEANPLTKEQLRTLKNYHFKESHSKLIQDRFVWQCYTGIRYIDAFNITKENVINNWLYFKPSKTEKHNVKVEQPLNRTALELLNKYDYDMRKLKIQNQPYNREIKNMFTVLRTAYPKLNYKSNYTSYTARDTFITLAVSGGTNWKAILKWVGQSSYTIMDRYISLESRDQENQMKKSFD